MQPECDDSILLEVEGHKARIDYDANIGMFRGEILGLNGGADFYGKTTDELRVELKNSLDVFLDICEEKGINPYRESYS